MSQTRDPIRLELLKNAFAAIADEMAVTVVRTARSFVIKEAMDFSTGLMDVQGGLMAQGLCLPVHMGAFPPTIQAVLEEFGQDIRPGDIYAVNDPYVGGGTHLPDIYVFQPVFYEGQLLGFSAAIGHQIDIGGRVAGGNACDNTEIFQEGLRIPPVKLFEEGKPNATMFKILRLNVRLPEQVVGDVMATVAACRRGEQGLQELARRYGVETLKREMQDLQDYAEEMTRAEFRALPDGVWTFEDFVDDDGFDPSPIRICVKLTKEGGRLTADFSGSSPQVRGSINMPLPMTRSCVYACVRSVLDPNLPTNAGFMRPIEIIAEPGSVINPLPPAPVAARGLVAMRTTEVIWGALAKILPDKVFACGAQGDFGVTIAGYHPGGKPFIHLEFLFGTWGGRPTKDANDGLSSPAVNYSNSPVEMLEGDQPIRIERYAFRMDSGGAGKHRGGLGLEREYRLVGADEAVLQVRGDRQRFRPYGLCGGLPGAAARSRLNAGTPEQQELPGKFLRTLKRGEAYRAVLAGGGGWGDPMERDPEAVLDDVRNEKVSPKAAREDYGVEIDIQTMAVDYPATRKLREPAS